MPEFADLPARTFGELPEGNISRNLHAEARGWAGVAVNAVYAEIELPDWGGWMVVEKKGHQARGYPPGQDWRESWQEVAMDQEVHVHAYLSGAPWGRGPGD